MKISWGKKRVLSPISVHFGTLALYKILDYVVQQEQDPKQIDGPTVNVFAL